MKAEIISIGTEILLGEMLNTNQQWLSRKLAESGIGVYYHSTVGDNPQRLANAIREGLRRSDIVITTGGLGPTVDDITLETIARVLGKDLGGAKAIENNVGSAPGFIIKGEGKILIALPGPPREIHPMFERSIIPFLRKRFKAKNALVIRTIKITGLPESAVNRKVKEILSSPRPVTTGIYAKPALIELKIMAEAKDRKAAEALIDKVDKKITARLKDYIFGRDGETLESVVGEKFSRARKTLAIAESCTGGLISSRITDVPGSSKYFKLGIVAYSNEIKISLLGVRPETLKGYGAVSRRTAVEMAKNIRRTANTDLGLSVTGIAGPGGATRNKPVGLVYIALAAAKKTTCREFRFKGEREVIKFKSSQAALDILRRSL